MKYKLVIFDFDGTLADSFHWFQDTFTTLAERHKFRRLELHELEAMRGQSARQIMQQLKIPFWKLPILGRQARQLQSEQIHTIKPFSGVPEMLERLAERGHTIAMATTNAWENVHRVLGPRHAALISHHECGAGMFGKHGQIKRILRDSRTPASQAVYIGDELRDLEAALRVRVDFGAVSWGYTNADALAAHKPAHLFANVEEIVESVM